MRGRGGRSSTRTRRRTHHADAAGRAGQGRRLGADDIVGRDIVEARGGRVVRMPLAPGFSTTELIEQVRRRSDAWPDDSSDFRRSTLPHALLAPPCRCSAGDARPGHAGAVTAGLTPAAKALAARRRLRAAGAGVTAPRRADRQGRRADHRGRAVLLRALEGASDAARSSMRCSRCRRFRSIRTAA